MSDIGDRSLSALMKARWADPEFRRRMLARWSDHEKRKRFTEAIRGFMQDPAYRHKMRLATAKNWADPEYRERTTERSLAANRRNWADPEYRERITRQLQDNRPVYRCRLGRFFTMRSKLEVAVAQWLDARQYSWEYEPQPRI